MKEMVNEPITGVSYGVNAKKSLHWSLRVARESLDLKPSHKASIQFIRSMAVSVVALIADFGLLVILKEVFGVYYLLAATISFGVGVAVNYALSVSWVFANRKLSNRHAEFVIFTIICAIGLGLNLAIIAGLVQVGHIDYRIAKAVSTVVVFFWNFLARKKILY